MVKKEAEQIFGPNEEVTMKFDGLVTPWISRRLSIG